MGVQVTERCGKRIGKRRKGEGKARNRGCRGSKGESRREKDTLVPILLIARLMRFFIRNPIIGVLYFWVHRVRDTQHLPFLLRGYTEYIRQEFINIWY